MGDFNYLGAKSNFFFENFAVFSYVRTHQLKKVIKKSKNMIRQKHWMGCFMFFF